MTSLFSTLDALPGACSDAFEHLADHCRENADHGFAVSPQDARELVALFDRLATRALFEEGIVETARARAKAERALDAIAIVEAKPDLVDVVALEAAIATGRVVLFNTGARRALGARPS
ncbi:hypothetical protein [Hansschlegelia zhihuaiae]|uniref:Uncharacterized protein n=1 Tax=Hansschlegelia zhihuaiae TaxID=405005 RepID=A0A4Q0MMS0_9HYPH|nr:hypothetical protein [Hansschlegelia zhihuaiae]RXF75048.1 hypothetical protein EK403_03085 [Hansschlegelia zhihuaiae]